MPRALSKEQRIQRLIDLNILVDAEDLETVAQYTWHIGHGGYPATNNPWADGPATLRMHRVLLAAASDQVVDHINGNRRDNRRCNLSLGTMADNNNNTRNSPRTVNLPRCVYLRAHGAYQVYVRQAHVRVCLGTYKTVDEAVAVRDTWYAEHGVLNGQGLLLSKDTEVYHDSNA